MAKADIEIVDGGGHHVVPTESWQTEAGATDILVGEPVKLKAAGSPYVIPLADADLTIGTDTAMIGIAQSASTHTAAADGSISIFIPLPGVKYRMKATTAANVDTETKVKALEGDRVVMNLTTGTYTLDENAGDAATSAFYICGGNYEHGTLDFTIRADATYLAA